MFTYPNIPRPHLKKFPRPHLAQACHENNFEKASLALKQKCDPNEMAIFDSFCDCKILCGFSHPVYTPLSLAILSDSLPLVKLLVQHGASLTIGCVGHRVFQKCWREGKYCEDEETPRSPLDYAAITGNAEMCSYLLSKGCDADAGRSHLFAIERGHYECALVIIRFGNCSGWVQDYMCNFIGDKGLCFLVVIGSPADDHRIAWVTPPGKKNELFKMGKTSLRIREKMDLWIKTKTDEMISLYRGEDAFLENDLALCGINDLIDMVTSYVGFPGVVDAFNCLYEIEYSDKDSVFYQKK